ncbi:MAG: RNA polymerase sigma factor [Saprospiraceae bacterium]
MLQVSKKSKIYSDVELIRLYQREQNSFFFNQLYQRYSGKVFAKCLSMLSDHGLAKDAVQEIFVKILLNLSRFDERSSFSTWLYSITYNFCIDLLRRKKKITLIFTEDVGRVNQEKVEEAPDSLLLEMKSDRLQTVLDLLPPGDRMILLLKYQDEMSIKDISSVLQKTESAVKMQIMRAKQRACDLHDELYAKEPLL